MRDQVTRREGRSETLILETRHVQETGGTAIEGEGEGEEGRGGSCGVGVR